VLALAAGLVVFFAVAPQASATLRVQSFNDPAGNSTLISYRITGGTLSAPIDFQLPIGEGAHRGESSYGVAPGTYVVQGLPPAGWRVVDIQCVGATPAVFSIDVPDGRVTVNHTMGAEDTCAFTNRPTSAAATSGGRTPGVAPSPPASDLPKITLPKKAALLRVTGGRRFAAATIRLTRRSVVRGQLLARGNRVVGAARVVRGAGTHVVRVNLTSSGLKLLRRQGQNRVRLTLRLVVAPVGGRAVQTFRFGARVTL
jgi:hypothetical protein